MRILVTCPPMLNAISTFDKIFEDLGFELVLMDIVQIASEEELCNILPTVDGWIIGDDPATAKVFKAGKAGKLRAAVKWGVGIDNVDFNACQALGIPISNTPKMFGGEVADLALSYVLALARHTFQIDRGIRQGKWPKYAGVSMSTSTVAVIGYGDIGRSTAARIKGFESEVIVYDPFAEEEAVSDGFRVCKWPENLEEADFIVVTCALNDKTRQMIGLNELAACKPGVKIINVSRGPIIDEKALINSLKSGHVHSAALDVFEIEPLPDNSELRNLENVILGTHNGSNTVSAVQRASLKAIDLLNEFLKSNKIG